MEPVTGSFGEDYAQELAVARKQLTALASAAPEALFVWRPVDGVRTFSEVLSHVAAVNFGLLHMAGKGEVGSNPFAELDPDAMPALIARLFEVERETAGKQAVIDLLSRAFDAVESVLATSANPEEKIGDASLRRFLLRMLSHSHEHMGQAVAYMRMYGTQVPWPDPLKD